MTALALLRHGHTAWNRAGRIQGRTDIALDPEARKGLSGLRFPAPWDKADLWSSPLLRAVETAQLVGGQAPQVTPALTEMNWGAWEGNHGADLITNPTSGYKHIEDWGWAFTPPNGERLSDLKDRVLSWACTLEQDSVAVCHIGVMRVLLATALNWDFTGTLPFQIKRNRLYIIDIGDQISLRDSTPTRLIEAKT